jgi:hypothetical protein
MKRGFYLAVPGLLLLGGVIVTTGGAQLVPVRWADEPQATLPASAFDAIHATAAYLVTVDDVPFQCNETTAGYLAVVKAPASDPGTRSHYLCICAEVFNDALESQGYKWALTDADNQPIEYCEPEVP